MKTRKHGNGLSHKEVVRFSNRLAFQGTLCIDKDQSKIGIGYDTGWRNACKYFAHELRKMLRESEYGL